MSTMKESPPPVPFELPQGEVRLPPPPDAPELRDPHWLINIIPVLGIGVMALFYVLRAATDSGNSALFAVPLLLLAVFTIAGSVLAQRWRRRDYERQRNENALGYIRLLHSKRARLQAAADVQRALLERHFPPPQTLLADVLHPAPRLRQHSPGDHLFTTVRVGLGRVPLSVKIITPDPDLHSAEANRAFHLADEYRSLENVPVVLSLREQAPLGLSGRREGVLGVVRAMLAQLAAHQTPADLQLVLLAAPEQRPQWDWLRWLPHTRLVPWLAFDEESQRQVLSRLSQIMDERRQSSIATRLPHLLVIVDDFSLESDAAVLQAILRHGAQVGLSALCIRADAGRLPASCRTLLHVEADSSLRVTGLGSASFVVQARGDRLSRQDAQSIARALASLVGQRTEQSERLPRYVEFLGLYGVEHVEQLQRRMHKLWQREIPDGVLPFPVMIGRDSPSSALHLALDEEHHGPHGVLAGTTGSGKSELLQTLICALAVEHHPQLLNFLLIDFKGGSTFGLFQDLPHTVGMVSNLDGALIERVLEALRSEVESRQRIFKEMNVRDITQFYRFYHRLPQGHVVPHLFIIVDEFAQLAKEMPEFLDELVRIAQMGRSLGLHLILGTQSPMDVITDEMNANLQFRICLRVQHAEASRAMLGRPDAAYLPSGWAGRGFLQVGARDVFMEFQTAYTGGDYRSDTHRSAEAVLEIVDEQGRKVDLLQEMVASSRAASDEPYTTALAIAQTIQDYSQRHEVAPAPPLLLPPLERQITLLDVFARAQLQGWNGEEWLPPGYDERGAPLVTGSAPVGIVDDVYTRRQPPLWIHLRPQPDRLQGKDGHVLLIGGVGTGKTSFLRTLALSQAMLHHPDELHIYVLSFTGGGLNDVAELLPHAERVVHGTESERVRRLFRRLIHTLEQRQAGREAHQPLILLCIDQYEQLRDSYYEPHMPDFERLLNEGRSVGIFLAFTANSISALPDRVRSLVQQRIALRLNDATDYLLSIGSLQHAVDTAMPPGRGFLYHNPPLLCQLSLPALQLSANDAAMQAQIQRQMQQMQAAYHAQQGTTQSPAPIEELPVRIPLHDLPLPETTAQLTTPLGCYDDDTLSLFTLDWAAHGAHFVVTGPPASGKSNLLRAAALMAARQFSPQQLRFLLVDFTGRSLRDLAHLKHCIKRVGDADSLAQELAHLHNELHAFQQRQSAPPYTVVLMDDYDVLSDALQTQPALLRQLRDDARLYGEQGLHIWVAGYLERIGDPLIRQLLMMRSGFALSTKESLYHFSVRSHDLPDDVMPEGRAIFVQYKQLQVVQIALVGDVPATVAHLNDDIWRDAPAAQWQHPARSRRETPSRRPASEDTSGLEIDSAGLLADLLGEDEER